MNTMPPFSVPLTRCVPRQCCSASKATTISKPKGLQRTSLVGTQIFGRLQSASFHASSGFRISTQQFRSYASWTPATESIDSDTQFMLNTLKKSFEMADTNGDGYLNRDELRAVLGRVGAGAEEVVDLQWITDSDLDRILDQYDTNKDGVISYDEFQLLAQDKVLLTKALVEYRAAFEALDTTGHRKIGPTALCKLFTKLGSPLKSYDNIVRIMDKYDVNKDGEIDFGEFLRLCRDEKALPLDEILDYAATTASNARTSPSPPSQTTQAAADAHTIAKEGQVFLINSECEFTSLLADNPDKVIVLFASLTWCRPCKKIIPAYAKCADAYSDSAVFIRFNGNSNQDTKVFFKRQLKVRVTPSFFFFKAGTLLGSCTGANAARFEENLRSHLGAVARDPLYIESTESAAPAAAA